MEVSGTGKSPNASLSFRYNANNEEIEELFNACEDDPPTPQCDPPSAVQSENASPKRGDRTPSIIDKYFKSMRSEKATEKDKTDDVKQEAKDKEDSRSSTPKDVSSSPMKEYLNRLGKRSTPEVNPEVKEPNETWKIFHDFKFKIAQAVEDMKTKSLEDTKDEKKTLPRENSASDSEDNSAVKDIDQQSVGDTDNQVSSLDSSMQNLSEITQPITAKPTEQDLSLPAEKNHSDSSDDTHKNLVYSEMVDERDLLTDSLIDVESGVEALEDTMDNFGEITNIPLYPEDSPMDLPIKQNAPNIPNTGLPPSNSDLPKHAQIQPTKKYFCNFTMYFITIFFLINLLLFPNANVWIGFLMGIWFFLLFGNFKQWVLDTYFSDNEPRASRVFQVKRNSAMPVTYTIPSVKEHRPLKKFEGWINHYRFPDYDPLDYHINKSTTAFMKLEGCNLRISYSRTKVAKRALWDEKLNRVTFYQHRLYNLIGARVILLPKGLVKRRQWSKKYPICIILNEKEKIQVLEKENSEAERRILEGNEKKKEQQFETESTETNTSPEKKKKFVWRRKEKNLSHSDPIEPGKEGLRHRLVRKMHRDKKTDSVSTSTEPVAEPPEEKRERSADDLTDEMELASKSTTSNKEEEEVEIDDSEMTKIKAFLEEADSMENADEGNTEGEWSVHVKSSKDKHSFIYLFARTGRDKFEWYRRLSAAVSDVASAESSTSEENVPETFCEKEPIELAVYKMTAEKDSVSFAKNVKTDTASESGGGVTITSLNQHALPHEFERYERNFWPYLMKIIQTHEITLKKQTADIAVMCQLEPTPKEHSKNKKKKNSDIKTPPPDCECRLLPAEVTWVNTALARLMYDLTRDPVMIARVQHRIQRKLCTLKLPSFMSPLLVTELSLSGACPLVERVLPVSYDARGVWLDADLRYDGGAFIALSTQINLMKLKKKNVTLEDQIILSTASENLIHSDSSVPITSIFSDKNLRKPAIYDSECEDSAESSSDDESPPIQPVDSSDNVSLQESTVSGPPPEGGSSKKKFLRMVDKIAMNKYFQQVTDYKYVKRAMEGLSNTDIKLHLEVHCLEGRLCLNLPPPPHDRVWIGFRSNPQLVLKARPAVGARTLRFAHISNWIEQKLSKEFEKVLVLPNMEDIIVDVMTPTPVNFE